MVEQVYQRISLDEAFMQVADVMARRGTCPRLQVGAVLAKEGMIVSTGYNGSPRGIAHCIDVGCRIQDNHCIATVHAELNAILQAGYHGIATRGATLYTNFLPCQGCSPKIVNAGVERVVYRDLYQNVNQPFTMDLFTQAGIRFDQLPQISIKGKRVE